MDDKELIARIKKKMHGEAWEAIEGRAKSTEEGNFYNIMGVGNEGVEIVCSSEDKDEVVRNLRVIQLRARFNSHRNIELFFWSSGEKITFEHFEEKAFLKYIKENAKPLGY